MSKSQHPFSSAKLALTRIRGDFERLIRDGIDPPVVLVHARRPVPHDVYQIDWSSIHHPDRGKRTIKNRSGWTHPDATDERTRILGGWSIPDDHSTLPGCERWFFAYGKPEIVDRINVSALEMMFLCIKQGADVAESLASIPDKAQYGWHAGYWYEVVFEIARRSLISIPLHAWTVPLADDLQGDWTWDGKRIDNPWTKLDQPPGWTMQVDRFCTASFDIIGLMIEWAENGVNPFNESFFTPADAVAKLNTLRRPDLDKSNYRTPSDWRKLLKSHELPNSETSWRTFRKDYNAEKHPTMRTYRFPISELIRAGVTVREAAEKR